VPEYRCSSCGKSRNQVERIIVGPGGLHLCNECVYAYLELLESSNKPDDQSGTSPRPNKEEQ
jgi:ATP-dependent Clp protease ATP-binding subunit ClpX